MTSSVVRTDAIRPSINDRKLHKWARGIKISYQTRGLLTPVREKNSLPGGFFFCWLYFSVSDLQRKRHLCQVPESRVTGSSNVITWTQRT